MNMRQRKRKFESIRHHSGTVLFYARFPGRQKSKYALKYSGRTVNAYKLKQYK